MNNISKLRIELAKRNFKRFKNPNIVAAMVTGSVAKGYADDNSDIDTMILYSKPVTKSEFERIIKGAKSTGGDIYHGSPKDGFACYYYIEGIKCDFGVGVYTDYEKLISQMMKKPEIDLTKHLMISGFVDGFDLHGKKWINKWRKKALKYTKTLQVMMVKHFLRFHPEWVLQKMAIERKDNIFFFESLIEAYGNILGILCGLNKMYHPGKLKGTEWTIRQMKIKPHNLAARYDNLFKIENIKAVEELYYLIREVIDLIDKHLPEISTNRARTILELKLRK